MTFPLSDVDASKQPNWVSNPDVLKGLRQLLIAKLSITAIDTKNPKDPTAQQLALIAQTLSRSAANEPTTYENGTITTSASSTASILTRQVERALTQVLGRAPGRGPDGFVKALNAAFPTSADGQVIFTPARSVVATYSPDGNSLSGQLSVEQANLYRQASIVIADALKVLEGLEPFDPIADLDAVEALVSLVKAQLNSLAEEFGRLDEPRRERVNIYFNTLKKFLDQLGTSARLVANTGTSFTQAPRGVSSSPSSNVDREVPNLVTANDEAQVAAYELVKNYVTILQNIWNQFVEQSVAEQASGSYSERLSRVSIMIPVIADSNASFMAAMDSIGFTQSERRSSAALFTTLNDNSGFKLLIGDPDSLNEATRYLRDNKVYLPNITVNDFNDWIDRFVTTEAPSVLATSGKFGLDFVTDQADTLFWVIGFVLYYLKVEDRCNEAKDRLLGNILSFDRVQQTLRELIFQLKTLADLGVHPSRLSLAASETSEKKPENPSAIIRMS